MDEFRVDPDDRELIDELLARDNTLLVVKYGGNPVVVGAPHQAAEGAGRLPAGRVADENSGRLALEVARHLKCRAVVACNAHYDPNKDWGPYMNALMEEKSHTLVETHGHGGKMTHNEIEISSGADELEPHSIQFENLMKHCFSKLSSSLKYFDLFMELNSFKTSGHYDNIYYTTRRNYDNEAYSLRVAFAHDMIPYHIECSPKIRISGAGHLPRWGEIVALAIAWSVAEARNIEDVSDELDIINPLFKDSKILAEIQETLNALTKMSYRTLTWTNKSLEAAISSTATNIDSVLRFGADAFISNLDSFRSFVYKSKKKKEESHEAEVTIDDHTAEVEHEADEVELEA